MKKWIDQQTIAKESENENNNENGNYNGNDNNNDNNNENDNRSKDSNKKIRLTMTMIVKKNLSEDWLFVFHCSRAMLRVTELILKETLGVSKFDTTLL